MRTIDLRSDTAADPTPEMRRAIAEAVVGDEQKREDPTVLALEERAAALLGQEEAIFVPSATMANQIALRLLSSPGDEVLAEATSHIFTNEAGGPAVHSGLAMRRIHSSTGHFSAADLHSAATRTDDPHHAQTTVVCIENTHNSSGGKVWPLRQLREVVADAHALGLSVHLDGARLVNASIASGVPMADYGRDCETVTLCLSKGLGCPFGAVLAISSELAPSARRLKHLFGGAMRQAGIVAAAGIYAFDHHVERVAEDHANARRLAEGLTEAGVVVLNPEVESNVLLIDVAVVGVSTGAALERLRRSGVLFSRGRREGLLRAMTHLGVDERDIDEAVSRAGSALATSRHASAKASAR